MADLYEHEREKQRKAEAGRLAFERLRRKRPTSSSTSSPVPSSSSSAPSPSSSQAGYASTSNYSTSSTVSTPSSGTRTPQKVETVPDELFGDAPSLPFTPHSPIIGPNVSTSTKYNSTPSKNAHTPTRFGTHTRLSSTSNPLAIPSSASPASPPFSTSSQPPSSALNPSLPSPQSSMAPPAATPALSPSPASPLPDTSLTSRIGILEAGNKALMVEKLQLSAQIRQLQTIVEQQKRSLESQAHEFTLLREENDALKAERDEIRNAREEEEPQREGENAEMLEEQMKAREERIMLLERSLTEEKDEKEALRKEREALVLLNEKLSHTNGDTGHNGAAYAEQGGAQSAVTDGAAQTSTTPSEEKLHTKLREMGECVSVAESLVRQREEEMEMMHDDINAYAKSLQQHFSAIVIERDQLLKEKEQWKRSGMDGESEAHGEYAGGATMAKLMTVIEKLSEHKKLLAAQLAEEVKKYTIEGAPPSIPSKVITSPRRSIASDISSVSGVHKTPRGQHIRVFSAEDSLSGSTGRETKGRDHIRSQSDTPPPSPPRKKGWIW